MLVLGSTLHQFDVTAGHLSSLNYLLVSPFTFCICSHLPVILLTLCVRWCITFLALHHRFPATSILLSFCFYLFYRNLALQYILVFCICLVYHYSIRFICCVFKSFKLTVFTLHSFMVTSG